MNMPEELTDNSLLQVDNSSVIIEEDQAVGNQ